MKVGKNKSSIAQLGLGLDNIGLIYAQVSTYAWTIYTQKQNTKQIFLEVMLKDSDLNEVVVMDQEENIMVNVPEGGHVEGGMKEQLYLGKFTSTKVLRVAKFYCLVSV